MIFEVTLIVPPFMDQMKNLSNEKFRIYALHIRINILFVINKSQTFLINFLTKYFGA